MARKTLFAVFSIGVIVIAAQLFFLTGAGLGYFPESYFRKSLIYFILTLGVFGWATTSTDKIEKAIFNTSFFKVLPKFLLAFGITFMSLLMLKVIIEPEILTSISKYIGTIPWYVAVFHCFVVAFDETLVFQGFFPNQLKSQGAGRPAIYLISSILFALFHIWAAGLAWLLILIYVPLGIFFLYSRYKWSPVIMIVPMAIHFAYNLFVLGFI